MHRARSGGSSPARGAGIGPLARVILAALLVSASALACSSGPGAAPSARDASGTAGAVEKPDLTVGLMQLPASAPLRIAIDKGYFEEQGLKVTFNFSQSGIFALPGLEAGLMDVMHSEHATAFAAQTKTGPDLRLVSEADVSVPETAALVGAPRSKIKAVEDLKGKKVGVNAVAATAFAVAATMRASGVDAEKAGVKYIETPFPNMWTLMDKGMLDAAFLPEPFLSLATAQGATVVAKESGVPAGLPQTGYYVTADFLSKYPKTVAAFQRGLLKAQKLAAADPREVERALPRHLKLPADAPPAVRLPEFAVATDARRLQGLAGLLLETGYLSAKFEVNTLLTGVPGARG